MARKMNRNVSRAGALVAAASLASAGMVRAAEYPWSPASGTASWNNNVHTASTADDTDNWGTGLGGAFPNAAGDVANIQLDVTAALTINLNQSITLGTLNIGDTGAGPASGIAIKPATGGTLTFAPFVAGGSTGVNVAANSGANGIEAPVTLAANSLFRIHNPSAGTFTFSAAVGGAGASVVKTGSGAATLSNDGSFTGGLTVNEGTFSVSGASGKLSGVTDTVAISLNGGGNLIVGGNSTAPASASGGRIADAARITMNGGHLRYAGGTNADSATEVFGTLDVSGGSGVVSMTRQAFTISQLNVGSVSRSAGATLQLRAQDRFGEDTTTSPGANYQRIMVTGGVPMVGGIVPWMLGGEGGAVINNQPRDFVTYDATKGLRPLTATEYSTNMATATATSNVKVGATTLSGAKAINSFRFNGTGALNLGTSSLTIHSGALYLGSANSVTNGNLIFESTASQAVEAVVWVASTESATISANITKASALTKGSTGTLTLTGANTYNGPTYIGAGVLAAGAANTLPSNTAVVLTDSTPNSLVSPLGAVVTRLNLAGFNQTIGSLAGGGVFGGNVELGSATLTTGGDNSSTAFGGVISGTGSLTKAGGGTFTLKNANTYSGLTKLSGGTLALGANSVLADGSNVELAGGTLATGGFDDVLGSLAVTAASVIDFNGPVGSVLQFADSAATAWTGTLGVHNWSGDQLFVGTDANGLTADQLSRITFFDASGGTYGANILPTGEVVAAVPEPTSVGLLAVAGMGLAARRRRR